VSRSFPPPYTQLTAFSSSSSANTNTTSISLSQLRQMHPALTSLLPSSSSLDYALSIFTDLPTCDNPLSNKLFRYLSRIAEPETAFLAYEKIRLKMACLVLTVLAFLHC
jgi:hypothetical protein